MKGFFTQGASVLLSAPITLDELEPLLADFEIVRRSDPEPDADFGGPSLLLAFRPEVRGYLAVDLQDRVWPDHMGDANETTLFGAWSTGHFGPLAYPGNLRRAVANSWGWREAGDVVTRHRAFVRLRLSYAYGAEKDDLVIPTDCDPRAELDFVTRVCSAILRHPSALAYFNPNGEALRSADFVAKSLASHAERQLPPLDVWSNVRLMRADGGWLLMDTVGMGQLDRQDLEACFPEDTFEPGDVDVFLRNVSLYLLENGEVIKDLNTIDGPGGVWRAHEVDEGLSDPPRRLLRFFPEDGSTPPAALRPRRPS
jgi:hypothetical protein